MDPQNAYDELLRRSREMTMVASTAALLHWDELTYMPPGGVENRGNQLAYLAGLAHEKSTDPRMRDLFAALDGSDLVADPESTSGANVRRLRRAYDRMVRLPKGLVQELARTTSAAQKEWQAARLNDEFAQFLPWLERIVALKRNEAACAAIDGDLYDALLDEYEPGARSDHLSRMFDALRSEIEPLLASILGAKKRVSKALHSREFPVDRQRVFVEAVADALGFDFHSGRLDTSAHPFSMLVGPGDSRITTRYSAQDFGAAFFSTVHEVGHALYEQGLEAAQYGTPLGEAASLGMHESQSRLWEVFVGHSRPFWQHFFPLARQVFHDVLHGISLNQFYRAINHVEPSLERVRADDVTYDLHILVRFEIEKALITADLAPADVPAAWNERYVRYLGVRPAGDAAGCLQDGHWSAGLIGYFPCYTLGNVYAAQLFARARADVPDIDGAMARGDFTGLLGWLRENVHRHGQRFDPTQLIKNATGSPPDHRPLVAALRAKYAEL